MVGMQVADQELLVKMLARNDTAANWTAQNPVLLRGEPGLETDTGKIKFGDGVKAWNVLPYSIPTAADVPLGPIDGMAATTVQEAVAENFRSVVDGKNLLETAVSDKGGTVEKAGGVATFAELRTGIAGIPAGGGGECTITYENYNPSDNADRQSWTPLTTRRGILAGAIAGSKAVFAGGYNGNYLSVVEACSEDGTVSNFPALSRSICSHAGASAGTKALFAGGVYRNSSMAATYYSNVDAYTEDGIRSVCTALPSTAANLCGATFGSKAVFGGGYNGARNAYLSAYSENGTRKSFANLYKAVSNCSAAQAGKYLVIAGGSDGSLARANACAYTEEGVRTVFPDLSVARAEMGASKAGQKAVFIGGSVLPGPVDAYTEDGVRETFATLSARVKLHAVTWMFKKVIFAGGESDPSTYLDAVHFYTEDGVFGTLESLSYQRESLAAVTLGKYAIFAGGSASAIFYGNIDAYADASTTFINVLSGGTYNFGEGETVVPGNLTNPEIVKLTLQKPVNGYIKYKGMTISG